MKCIAFFLTVLVFGMSHVCADNSKPMTVDELYFGDYNKAVKMTKAEAKMYAKENNTIVVFFSDEMSPSAVEDTNDFLENRGYDVTLASGFKLPPNQKEPLLRVWVAGLMAGIYNTNQIGDGSAYVRIIRTIKKTGMKPDPNKIVNLYSDN